MSTQRKETGHLDLLPTRKGRKKRKEKKKKAVLASRGSLPEEVEEDSFAQTTITHRELIVAKRAHDRHDKGSPRNNHIGTPWFQERDLASFNQRSRRQCVKELPRPSHRQPMAVYSSGGIDGEPQIYRRESGRGPGGPDKRRPLEIG